MRNQLFIFICIFLIACDGSDSKPKPATNDNTSSATDVATVDDGKGIGEIKEVKLNDPLDQEMIQRGQAISDMKCAACHRYTEMRVVGPGWKGVTERRKPEWIMNMITNVEVMLEQDETARKLLEECLTRMPNQNLTVADARDVLEFMYAIDQGKVSK